MCYNKSTIGSEIIRSVDSRKISILVFKNSVFFCWWNSFFGCIGDGLCYIMLIMTAINGGIILERKKRTPLQRVTMLFIWMMLIATLGSLVFGTVASLNLI